MAEFVQTMKDWKRMCDTIKLCDDCPMQKEDGWTYVLCSEGGISSARPEVAEKVIVKWAAEHPEPVYPAWRDWLRDLYGNPKMTMTDILESPIDPEIAQRLNIVPRRARNGENQES